MGNYYVAYDKAYKREVEELVGSGVSREKAEKEAPILLEAQELLRKWEAGDEEVVGLWKMMNGWVYEGFNETYEALGG